MSQPKMTSSDDSEELTIESRRTRSREAVQRGRMWVIIIFLSQRLTDFLLYWFTEPSDHPRMVGALLNSAAWTTAMLIGIWCRKNWARYVLATLMVLGVLIAFIFVPSALAEVSIREPIVQVMVLCGVVNGLTVWCLVGVPAVRRLTRG
jgi:hypothetical protein